MNGYLALFVLPLSSLHAQGAPPVFVPKNTPPTGAVLIEIEPRQSNRSCLGENGQVVRIYSGDSRRSIGSFGK